MFTLFSAAYSVGGIFVSNRTEPVLTRALSSSFSHSDSEVSVLIPRCICFITEAYTNVIPVKVKG